LDDGVEVLLRHVHLQEHLLAREEHAGEEVPKRVDSFTFLRLVADRGRDEHAGRRL